MLDKNFISLIFFRSRQLLFDDNFAERTQIQYQSTHKATSRFDTNVQQRRFS